MSRNGEVDRDGYVKLGVVSPDGFKEGIHFSIMHRMTRENIVFNYLCDLLASLLSLSLWKTNTLDHIVSYLCHPSLYVDQCDFLLIVPTD